MVRAKSNLHVEAAWPSPAQPERAADLRKQWSEAARICPESGLADFMRATLDDPGLSACLDAVFGGSPYLTDSLFKEPAVLRALSDAAPETVLADLSERLSAEIADAGDAEAKAALRRYKRRAALLIALCDIGGLRDLEAITGALSEVAETAIGAALRHLIARDVARGRLVPDTAPAECGLTVLGMGKLGAGELNFSSDVDLIVFYDPDKLPAKSADLARDLAIGLTKGLVDCLESRTADGYVFRTDLRLRPDPGSTPVAVSIPAAEQYYESLGQNWERAAMIKARPVAGDIALGESFLDFLKPYIWRKNLDFAAIEDIHSIKRQINARPGGGKMTVAGHNIKLGRGGIREIEFFAQTQQLIWGGRRPELRVRQTLTALDGLCAAGLVEPATRDDLAAAYRFHRRIEHRLQMIDDRQTHEIPAQDEKFRHFAIFFGARDPEALGAEIGAALTTVENHYADLFRDSPTLAAGGNLVFTGGEDDPETLRTLKEMGFSNPVAITAEIRGWHHGRHRATRSVKTRQILTELIPTILGALSNTPHPDQAFLNFAQFIRSLPSGMQVFSLFRNQPGLLDLVAETMGFAPRLANHFAAHPHLFDAVLSPDFFDDLSDRAALAAELDRLLTDAADFEDMMNICRRWARDRQFQVGLLFLRTRLDALSAGHAYSDIAEVAIRALTDATFAAFTEKYGRIAESRFAIVALGKLGSREMTPTSDLDLIFVYDAPEDLAESDGRTRLAAPSYFARLAQRCIGAFTAQTAEGALFPVDMRLRPSGNAGPLATSFAAFSKYHREQAWTWERQALCRARTILGDASLIQAIDTEIRDTLRAPRDGAALRADVIDMRRRLHREKAKDPYDIKHMPGGMVDVEFICQCLILDYAREFPELGPGETVDQIATLNRLGLLTDDDAAILTEAYRIYLTVLGVLRLTVSEVRDPTSVPEPLKNRLVDAICADAPTPPCVDFDQLLAHMKRGATGVREIFTRLIGPVNDPDG